MRCIKPNYGLQVGLFENSYVVTQLRHTGLLQCCELLKHGYPTRISYSEIAQRYTPVLPKELLALPCLASSERLLTSAVLYGFEVDPSLYQLGATRLFFRAGHHAPGVQTQGTGPTLPAVASLLLASLLLAPCLPHTPSAPYDR